MVKNQTPLRFKAFGYASQHHSLNNLPSVRKLTSPQVYDLAYKARPSGVNFSLSQKDLGTAISSVRQ